MKKITKYYTEEEIVEAVLTQNPEFVTVCQLIFDDATDDEGILKVKNKEL